MSHGHEEGVARQSPSLAKGTLVSVFGLASEAGQRLTGDSGCILSFDAERGRYGVQLDADGSCKSFKEENVTVAGTPVELHGLLSAGSVWLNGETGHVESIDPTTQRYIVQLDSDGSSKKVKGCNLRAKQLPGEALQQLCEAPANQTFAALPPDASEHSTSSSAEPGPMRSPFGVIPVDDEISAAVEASLREADSRTVGVNAQISDVLMRNTPALSDAKIVVLTFSRDPAALAQTLLQAAELAPFKEALAAEGLDVELPSGAKIFVRPEHHAPAVEAIRLFSLSLKPKHVIVDVALEQDVLKLT